MNLARRPVGSLSWRATTSAAGRVTRWTFTVTVWRAGAPRSVMRRGAMPRSEQGRAWHSRTASAGPSTVPRPRTCACPDVSPPSQVEQTPLRHEYGIAYPARSAASSTVSSGSQGKLMPVPATST